MQCDAFMITACKGAVLCWDLWRARTTRIIGWGWPHSVPDNARNSQENLIQPLKVAKNPKSTLYFLLIPPGPRCQTRLRTTEEFGGGLWSGGYISLGVFRF